MNRLAYLGRKAARAAGVFSGLLLIGTLLVLASAMRHAMVGV